MVDTITRQDLKNKIESDETFTLIEALPEEYYKKAHIPGAIRLTADELEEKSGELPNDKEALIVTYCANPSCPSSETLANALEDRGYSNVLEYAEGKSDWKEAGYNLTSAGSQTGTQSTGGCSTESKSSSGCGCSSEAA